MGELAECRTCGDSVAEGVNKCPSCGEYKPTGEEVQCQGGGWFDNCENMVLKEEKVCPECSEWPEDKKCPGCGGNVNPAANRCPNCGHFPSVPSWLQ